MLIPIILIFGCLFFFCIGAEFISWAIANIIIDGSDIKNMILLLIGAIIAAFGIFSIDKSIEYYYEKESPKTEITTSISPQIDTIITIRNSVSDTVYIYKFNLTEK